MASYLRFGEIPKDERSINFIKMSNRRNDDFSWALDTNGYEDALKYVPERAFERGVSVFEMGEDGMPVLHNIREVSSLACRIGDKKIYQVTGDEVDRGNDGEPLIINVKIEKRRRIKNEKLEKHILTYLAKHFMLVIHRKDDKDEGRKEYRLFTFNRETQVNFTTKEVKRLVSSCPDDGFVKIPSHDYFVFCDFEFHFPAEGFDTEWLIKR